MNETAIKFELLNSLYHILIIKEKLSLLFPVLLHACLYNDLLYSNLFRVIRSIIIKCNKQNAANDICSNFRRIVQGNNRRGNIGEWCVKLFLELKSTKFVFIKYAIIFL